jgi:hypothetical protein
MKFSIKKYWFWLLFAVIVIINFTSAYYPKIIDIIYSQHLYRFITTPIRLLTHWFPFSLAGILIISVILVIIYFMYLILSKKLKFKVKYILKPLAFLYMTFILIWGLNYQRQSIGHHLDLNMQTYGIDEVKMVLEDLILEANFLRESLIEDEHGVFVTNMSFKELSFEAKRGFELQSDQHPVFKGAFLHVKPVLFSSLMIYTGIDGMYFPFTAEAHINTSSPELYRPFTMLHEIAHQIGFAREDEANFIAYYIGSKHPNDAFKYSSTLLVLNYLMKIIKNHDLDLHQAYLNSLSSKIIRDLEAYQAFWISIDHPIRTISFKINDIFLKANQQQDGAQSYGRVTDWLIAYHLG